jgi:hypothetical protein
MGRVSPDTTSDQVYNEGSGKLLTSGGVGTTVAVLVADGRSVIVAVGGSGVLVAGSKGVCVAGCSGAVRVEHAPNNKRARIALKVNRL